MSINQYNKIQTIGPIAASAAQVAAHDITSLTSDRARIGGAARIRLAGGSHPSGCKLLFAGRATGTGAVADNEDASVVLMAGVLAGPNTDKEAPSLLLLPLTDAFTITFGALTIDRVIGDGTIITMRLADTVATPTLTGFGTALLAAYASFQPQTYSPGGDGIGCLILPQLPAMESLVVDIYGASANDRFVLVDSHS